MLMVCCSMASWMATWSLTSILSNSSMQHTPYRRKKTLLSFPGNTLGNLPCCPPRRLTLTLSASIRAPASMTNSWDSSSLTTAAVRPAALLALPLVYTALGLNSSTCLNTHTKFKMPFSLTALGFTTSCPRYLRSNRTLIASHT